MTRWNSTVSFTLTTDTNNFSLLTCISIDGLPSLFLYLLLAHCTVRNTKYVLNHVLTYLSNNEGRPQWRTSKDETVACIHNCDFKETFSVFTREKVYTCPYWMNDSWLYVLTLWVVLCHRRNKDTGMTRSIDFLFYTTHPKWKDLGGSYFLYRNVVVVTRSPTTT